MLTYILSLLVDSIKETRADTFTRAIADIMELLLEIEILKGDLGYGSDRQDRICQGENGKDYAIGTARYPGKAHALYTWRKRGDSSLFAWTFHMR